MGGLSLRRVLAVRTRQTLLRARGEPARSDQLLENTADTTLSYSSIRVLQTARVDVSSINSARTQPTRCVRNFPLRSAGLHCRGN